MTRIMIVGPSPDAPSAYGIGTRYLAYYLKKAGHDVLISTNNREGQEEPFLIKDQIVTLCPRREPIGMSPDREGRHSVPLNIRKYQPQIVITNKDAFCFPYFVSEDFMDKELRERFKWIAWFPIDGDHPKGLPRTYRKILEGADALCTYTPRSRAAVHRAGFKECSVVPYGYDPDIFKPVEPVDSKAVKKRIGGTTKLSTQFVYGMDAVNSTRKNHPVAVKGYALLREKLGDRVGLWLHMTNFQHGGFWLEDFTDKYGLEGNIYKSIDYEYVPIRQEEVEYMYRAWDCMITSSGGEGMCVPLVQGMAMGIPQIVTRYWATEEVGGDAAVFLEPEFIWDDFISLDKAFVSGEQCRDRMLEVYQDADLRARCRERGIKRAQNYTWERCMGEMLKVVDRVSE